MSNNGQTSNSIRNKLNSIIFGTDTFAGKAFDLMLIISIVLSVVVVMLDSIKPVGVTYGVALGVLEWFFTIQFTIEYLLRIYCSPKPLRYVRSFFGAVDLLAILPSYLGLVFPFGSALGVIRVLRVLRIFRILKLALYVREANLLASALYASRRKILIFFFTVITLVIVLGSIMYVVEYDPNRTGGFDNIPRSIYWAIVTLTTVGYGDISPQTALGQFISSIVMILGYSIIAVPTGIVTAELTTSVIKQHKSRGDSCPHCGKKLGD